MDPISTVGTIMSIVSIADDLANFCGRMTELMRDVEDVEDCALDFESVLGELQGLSKTLGGIGEMFSRPASVKTLQSLEGDLLKRQVMVTVLTLGHFRLFLEHGDIYCGHRWDKIQAVIRAAQTCLVCIQRGVDAFKSEKCSGPGQDTGTLPILLHSDKHASAAIRPSQNKQSDKTMVTHNKSVYVLNTDGTWSRIPDVQRWARYGHLADSRKNDLWKYLNWRLFGAAVPGSVIMGIWAPLQRAKDAGLLEYRRPISSVLSSLSPDTVSVLASPAALVLATTATTMALTAYHYLLPNQRYQDVIMVVFIAVGAVAGRLAGLNGTDIVLGVAPWCTLLAMLVGRCCLKM